MISEVREEPDYIASGRCKSGRRWFWCVSARSYDHDERHCEDPVCSPGLTGHEYGWEDTEEEALDAMQAAGTRLSGLPWGRGIGRPTWAAEILKQINAARRRARPPKPGASRSRSRRVPVRAMVLVGLRQSPVRDPQGNQRDPHRQEDREADLPRPHRPVGPPRRRRHPRVHRPAGARDRHPLPGLLPEGRSRRPGLRDARPRLPHCVHLGTPLGQIDPRCLRSGGCGKTCPIDTPGRECAQHGYTWDHCPHGQAAGACYHGSPAGVADLPGRSHYRGGTVYATREAAEEYLYSWERERERKRKEREPELKQLRLAMVKAHPDAGGSHEAFLEARERYERALRQAS